MRPRHVDDGGKLTEVIGIDFSGACDAGRKIWVAVGGKDRYERFTIKKLFRATDLTDGIASPEAAVPALARFIANQGEAIIGCDFPFGLPSALIDSRTWLDFAIDYQARFTNPDRFREIMREITDRHEHKRQTDRIAKTPFNSYNLRLYRQTWWGITGILAPLAKADRIRVRPQQPARANLPQVMEVCAASTLKSISFYPPYKGAGAKAKANRSRIVKTLVERGCLAPPEKRHRNRMIADLGGDALDAVIGAIAASRADLAAKPNDHERLEGRVYFAI